MKDGIAIIGSGLIGSEVAAAIKSHYKGAFEVHMIGLEDVPLEMAVGKEIGSMLASEHEKAGVKLHMGAKVAEVIKNDKGKATGVVLGDGTTINCSLVIVGAGVRPATKWLERSETGIKTDKAGAVVCDPFL